MATGAISPWPVGQSCSGVATPLAQTFREADTLSALPHYQRKVRRAGSAVPGAMRLKPLSRFLGEEAGDGSDIWDVQRAVPLQAIFFLVLGDKDWAEPVGAGQAVCLLAGLGLQTSKCVLREKPLDEIAASTLQRFENLCDLVQAVPAYLLDLGINGTFWQEIERVTQCTEPGGSA
jgi:hypothetical protein